MDTVLFFAALFVGAEIPPFDKTQGIKIDRQRFSLPAEFEIERIAISPLIERPMHGDFDEMGRLYVADSSGSNDKVENQLRDRPHRIVRLEDADGDGRFDKSIVFADKMMLPEGAMWLDGSLYVAAPPSIWKLTDTNDDGVADARVEWYQGKSLTRCANDLHGPYLGPDGWIYWTKGGFANQRIERIGLPPIVGRASHLFRCRPDGSGIESVMAGGMDNPVEVAFTAGGERILSTTFLEKPKSVNRDGLIHAIYGGVYGQIHEEKTGEIETGEVLPPLSHTGTSSPCGLMSYRSDVFGSEFQGNLFTAHFSTHKITRTVLTPAGATFEAKDSDFLVSDNLDFHPTDVLEDADGSLIVLDTGAWYTLCCPSSQIAKSDVLGGIYRIRRKDTERINDPRGLQIDWRDQSDVQLCQRLHDARRVVAERASRELTRRGDQAVSVIEPFLFTTTDTEARVLAIWALSRIAMPKAKATIRSLLESTDETVRQAAIHSICVNRDSEAIPQLLSILKQSSLHNRRVTAEALGRLKAESAIPLILELAGLENDRILEHSLTFALIEISRPDLIKPALSSGNPRVLRTALIALDQLQDGGLTPQVVAPFLTSENRHLRDTAIWILDRHSDWGDSLHEYLRTRLHQKPLSNDDCAELHWQLAKLSRSVAVQRLLAETVSSSSASIEARITCLKAMLEAVYRQPPDGWEASLVRPIESGNLEEILWAVQVARNLSQKRPPISELRNALLRMISNERIEPAIRLNGLSAAAPSMDGMDDRSFSFADSFLNSDDMITQRLAALEVLSKIKLRPDQLAVLLKRVPNASPLEIDRLLETFAFSAEPSVLATLARSLSMSDGLAAIKPETLERVFPPASPITKGYYDQVVGRLRETTKVQRGKLESLLASATEGDIRRGQEVFHSTRAACSACHKIGYRGGLIGPNLTKIGQSRSERDLLESIVFPSSTFVRGYEPVTILTHGGKTHSGVLKADSAEELVLQVNAQDEVKIPRDQVEVIQPATISIMPAGLDQKLSTQDLIDLVAFLRNCR